MPTLELTRMQAKAGSYDPATRTFEAVAATTTPVKRRDERGDFDEVLDMAKLANLGELQSLPVLDSHSASSVRDTIGTISGGRIENDALVLTARLSGATDVEPIAARIEDGTLRNVSIGYAVESWAESRVNGRRTLTPQKWKVKELSLTSTPADARATIRSSAMPETLSPKTGQITDDEKSRRSEIRTLCRSAKFTDEQADEFIDTDATVEDVKVAIFDAGKAITRNAPAQVRTHAPSNDDPSVIRERMTDALTYRMTGGELKDEAKPYVEMSLFDMARSSVERTGASTTAMGRDEILQRSSHATSDFPLLVSNAAGKTAQQAYQIAESPLKKLCRKQVVRDFKPTTAIRLGEMGELLPMTENGEFQGTTRAENGESMKIDTYGRRIDVSRNLIFNDDLSLFADITREFGNSSAETEASNLVANIEGNPNLSDGTAVFDASRGNVHTAASAGAINETEISAVRKAMRGRKGLDGKTPINAKAKYMLVHPELETTAEKFLAEIQANATEDVNPFSGKMQLIVEPRLTSETDYYVFSDPAQLAGMRYAYLAGAEGVQVQRMDMWDRLGVSFRAFLDYGSGWLDWRGATKITA